MTPYKTDEIFTAEFLELVNKAAPEVCIAYQENKQEDHGDYA